MRYLTVIVYSLVIEQNRVIKGTSKNMRMLVTYLTELMFMLITAPFFIIVS